MSRFVEEIRELRPVSLKEEEVLPLTEAARQLGLSPTAVVDLCQRGQMRRILDTSEPNPRKRGRVLRADVLQELARRRGRPEDRRLKRKRGRPMAG